MDSPLITVHVLCSVILITIYRIFCPTNQSCAQKPQTASFHVVAYYSTECPICKKTARPFADIMKEYAPRGLSFTLVFPGTFEKKNKVERFCREYGISENASIILDKSHEWVSRYRASVTPEFFLINSLGEILYSGALDDRFVKVGVHKPKAEQHYLKEAIRAALTGAEIPVKRTEPVGCFISR